MIEFVPGHPDHAALLADRLRPEDAAECTGSGASPLDALTSSLTHSVWSRTAFVDGQAAATWGLTAPMLAGDIGCPWLLTTPLVERNRKTFLRENRKFVAFALEIFPVLENYVDARYIRALNWLRWLGFTIYAPEPMGRAMFCKVEKRRGF